jgi:hypothetical protein
MSRLFGPLQMFWGILLFGLFLHLSIAFIPGFGIAQAALLSNLYKQVWWKTLTAVISANAWIPVVGGIGLLGATVMAQVAHEREQRDLIRERLQTVAVVEEKIQKGLQGTSHAYRAADVSRRGSLEEENRRLRQTIVSLTKEIQLLRDRTKVK